MIGPWVPTGPALLFCPADRPERYAKALDRADMVILDLEDAVAPDDKPAARQALIDHPLDPERVLVRINPVGTVDHRADLEILDEAGYQTVVLAKTETADQVFSVGRPVIAQVETPMGAVRCEDIAAAEMCVGMLWGSEDLIDGLGGRSSRFGADETRPGAYRDVPRFVRARVRLAAAAFGKTAIDAVYPDIADEAGLAREVRDAVALGYAATACIHPSQVPVVRAGYTPTDEEIDRAQRLLDESEKRDGGVFEFEGSMVDAPVFGQAQAVLNRAEGDD
ncbi:MAG: CoA ester lyase [Gordonia sp. (in: high G+C Gram-positive bacteria)]|uniref:HpcH/HpaI aldolase/citrate lyase family protein n=1 Tax=Gordonia sp. (in: high G+C Gram-positive bacteria) TaxID=84139 RepID=UPI0039E64BBF